MILIYCKQTSPRIRYTFKLIIEGLLREQYAFTSDVEEFVTFDGPKINYSKDPQQGGLFIESHGLLSQKEIESIEINYFEVEGQPALFPVYNEKSAFKFDPFAAAFYLVVRYEEYMPFVRDEYGRFQAKESVAWKNGFLDKPVVNTWAAMIAEKIKEIWPEWSPGEKAYNFIPTIDINAAWLYKRKGFFRTIAGLVSSLSSGRFKEAFERILVIIGSNADPLDTYDEQLAIHKKYALSTIYFVLFADYDTNDRNIPVNNRHFNILIKSLADYCRIGIHTSFASLKSAEKLALEFKRLSAVMNKEITSTRQHFQVLKMPITYRSFVNRDVEDDYSMGYAVTPGFRAGIADPFNFYDLDIEAETNMKIWPYAIVDKGLEYGYDMDKSFKPIIERVKAVNGTLIILWNNESLVKEGEGRVNIQTYEEVIKMAL